MENTIEELTAASARLNQEIETLKAEVAANQQALEKARKLQEQADQCEREAEAAELLQQQAEADAASMPELRAALQFQKQVESYQSVPPLQKAPETPVPEQNATAAASSSAAQASAPEAAAH